MEHATHRQTNPRKPQTSGECKASTVKCKMEGAKHRVRKSRIETWFCETGPDNLPIFKLPCHGKWGLNLMTDKSLLLARWCIPTCRFEMFVSCVCLWHGVPKKGHERYKFRQEEKFERDHKKYSHFLRWCSVLALLWHFQILWSLNLQVFQTSPLVPWSLGPLVPWSFGPLVLWSSGPLVFWSLGLLDP